MRQLRTGYAVLMAVLLSLPTWAQNLVPNPSFEHYNNCPNGLGGLAYSPGYTSFPTVVGWVSPVQNSSSSDYFNACASLSSYSSIPLNSFGYQPARTGNGYAGIIAWEGRLQGSTMTSNFGEYLQCRLLQPMKAGSRYCVTFYVNTAVANAPFNFVGIDRFGANFSATQPVQTTGLTMNLPYHIRNNAGSFLTDTSGWTKITGIYTAQGGEQWMTMGWFDNGVPAFQPINPATPVPTDFYRTYLYVEDITVTEVTPTDTFITVRDTVFCKIDDIDLALQSSGQLGDYLWSNGATTPGINVVKDTGKFWCLAKVGCNTYIDSFVIRFDSVQKLSLPAEIINCKNQPVTIDAKYTNGTYLWNTGENTEKITVNKTGLYILTINNKCGTQTDSVHVYIQPPTPAPKPADTVICQFVTNPVINVSGNGIQWYTHEKGVYGTGFQPPIVTREPGSYNLFITQTIGKCESERSPVKISITYTPHEELGDKVVMCGNDLKMIGTAEVPGVDYKWNTGASVCCVLPERDGLYKRAATNECGSFVDSIYVYHTECNDCIALPNAFTPVKGYNSNTIFRPLIKCPVSEFNMKIYNRWGNKVYESADVTEGWDGRYNYDWAPMGVYVYVIEYRAKDKLQKQVLKGNVTLLR